MNRRVRLQCRGLACGYPGRTVLRDINLEVFEGESLALLGINGSGKSTLLRTFSKLLEPLEGSIEISGRNVRETGFQEFARLVASVPQEEPAPFPFLVREVVTMGRIALGSGIFDTNEDRAAAESAMAIAGCQELADRPITQLSGGERQRVWIARAIAQDTPVILMDEPTSHLDVSHQLATAALARRLASEGRSVISAVHDLNLAAAMADRALLVGFGRMLLDAPVGEALSSRTLDETYGVRFERVRAESGRVLLIPT